MPTTRGYITASRFTELTNLSVTDLVEWERQINIAERHVDLVCGATPSFHHPRVVTVSSATSNTMISPELNSDKDDYYNNLSVEIKQNTGAGYSGFITDYDSTTTTVTVSGSFETNPDSTSKVVISQVAVFPRIRDFDADGRPFIPQAVTEACAYALEYAYIKGGDAGFNSNAFSFGGGVDSESIGNYSIKYSPTSDQDSIGLIGARAYQTLERAGLIVRIGHII